jgi:spermidine/putrescine transport system permease protein
MTDRRKWLRTSLVVFFVPYLLWMGFLFVLPHLDLLYISFLKFRTAEPTLSNYTNFFINPLYRNTFARTAAYAILNTLLTLVISFPVAYFITKILRGKATRIMTLIIIMPFWISELIRAFAWMNLLRESGTINYFFNLIGLTAVNVELLYSNTAIMIGLVYASMLFMIVPITTTLDTLDDSLIEAAFDLGGSPLSVMKDVIIPHAAPGIASGCILVFMLSLGNFVTVTLLGGKNSLWFTEQIYNQFILRFNWNQGAAFGFVFLLLSILIVWISLKITGQSVTKVLK